MGDIVTAAFTALTERKTSPSPYKILRFIMDKHLINWPEQYFVYTREYELGLNYVDSCYIVIEQHRELLTDVEYSQWDRDLIYFRLNMLDYLNEWQQYIEIFEDARVHKPYSLTYCRTEKTDGAEEDNQFNSYILSRKQDVQYVHFLYPASHRYEVIKRKREREISGKATNHLERHQREHLAPGEQEQRISRFIEWFVEGMKQLMKDKAVR